MVYALFVLGFVLLIKGADWLIEGAVNLARRFQVSDLVIGMTVVAFGTSAPELVVNLIASFSGKSDLATGNILGSNVANILLVPGVAALIYPLAVKKKTARVDLPLSAISVVLLLLLALNFQFADWKGMHLLSQIDGGVLVLFFAGFLWYSFSSGDVHADEELADIHSDSLPKSIFLVLLGLAGLAVGGDWIVQGAIEIARSFGMSEALIGLTIVAIGTSLPEVAASAMAAKKKNADLAMGNVIGSNLFNVLWVLGCSSLIRPLDMPGRAVVDGGLVVLASVFVFAVIVLPKKWQINLPKGVLLLVAYAGYITFLVLREVG